MSWVLVVYIYAGAFAKGDSVTITHIPGFTSEQACKSAAAPMNQLVDGSFKTIRTICVRQQ